MENYYNTHGGAVNKHTVSRRIITRNFIRSSHSWNIRTNLLRSSIIVHYDLTLFDRIRMRSRRIESCRWHCGGSSLARRRRIIINLRTGWQIPLMHRCTCARNKEIKMIRISPFFLFKHLCIRKRKMVYTLYILNLIFCSMLLLKYTHFKSQYYLVEFLVGHNK